MTSSNDEEKYTDENYWTQKEDATFDGIPTNVQLGHFI